MSKTYLQEKITGTQGQVVGFDASGNAVAQALPTMDYIPTSQKGAASGVASLGSDGKVPPTQMPYQYSQTDLTAGTSSLATGTLYFVYE